MSLLATGAENDNYIISSSLFVVSKGLPPRIKRIGAETIGRLRHLRQYSLRAAAAGGPSESGNGGSGHHDDTRTDEHFSNTLDDFAFVRV